jgi:hypothetical protein
MLGARCFFWGAYGASDKRGLKCGICERRERTKDFLAGRPPKDGTKHGLKLVPLASHDKFGCFSSIGIGIDQAEVPPLRSAACAFTNKAGARKKKPGYSGRDDTVRERRARRR